MKNIKKEDFDKLKDIGLFEKCPYCGNNNWAVLAKKDNDFIDVFSFPEIRINDDSNQDNFEFTDNIFPVAIMFCEKCGDVRPISFNSLQEKIIIINQDEPE